MHRESHTNKHNIQKINTQTLQKYVNTNTSTHLVEYCSWQVAILGKRANDSVCLFILAVPDYRIKY